MEYDDGPITTTKSCNNCIHSVATSRGLACDDRNAFWRLLTGQRLIKPPYTNTCENFEPLPQNLTKNCKFCTYFGLHHASPACWNVDILTALLAGPKPTSATNACQDFELADKFKHNLPIAHKSR